MKILKSPYLDDLYLFQLWDKVIRINFLLRQIDHFKKDSLLFERTYSEDWMEISTADVCEDENLLIKRAVLLINYLYIESDGKVELFRNTEDPGTFLIKENGKAIQVNAATNRLSDESDALFLERKYNLNAP